MIKSSLYFIYNNQLSTDFGVYNVSIQDGLYEEPFLSSSEIIEITTKSRDIPFFQQIKRKPFEFNITFAFIEAWDASKLADLARLFYVDFYAPMVFSESPDKIYWCVPVGEPIISHQGTQGYVTMNFRCHAPWATSPVYSSEVYDLTSNPVGGTTVQIVNNGDIPMYLLINVEIISGSTFSITNLSDGGKVLSFTGLSIAEILEINTETEDITTNVPLTYRYDDFSGEYLSLPRGVNNLLIKGNIKIQFQYEFRLLQS